MLKANMKMKMLLEQLNALSLDDVIAKKKTSAIHYYKDSNNFYPLSNISIPTEIDVFFSIMFDAKKTGSINETAEKTFKRNGLRFFRLVKNENEQYMLARNTDGLLSAPNGKYEFVITNISNVCEMRIGSGIPHFYLNGKSHNHVILAGEIEFIKVGGVGEIVEINDKSGGYHIKDNNPAIFQLKLKSIRKAIQAVGLPLDKFKFAFENENPPVLNSRISSIHYLKSLSKNVPEIKREKFVQKRTALKSCRF